MNVSKNVAARFIAQCRINPTATSGINVAAGHYMKYYRVSNKCHCEERSDEAIPVFSA